MMAPSRRLKIRELLEHREFVDLDSLCRELEASESSIRRDLIVLESEGLLKRVYGGAMALQAHDHDLDFAWQSTKESDAKRRIAKAAAALVEEEQSLILDGGSTVAAVASEIADRPLHVMTNSLPIADVFSEARRIELTLTGGYLYPRLRIMVGPLCEQMLSRVTADAVIMGIASVTEAGFSNNNSLVVGSERIMIEVARRVIIVADHTKFGRGAMIPLAPLEVADVVISDRDLAPECQQLLRSAGVEVILA